MMLKIFSQKSKRIISATLASAMALTLIAGVPVMANPEVNLNTSTLISTNTEITVYGGTTDSIEEVTVSKKSDENYMTLSEIASENASVQLTAADIDNRKSGCDLSFFPSRNDPLFEYPDYIREVSREVFDKYDDVRVYIISRDGSLLSSDTGNSYGETYSQVVAMTAQLQNTAFNLAGVVGAYNNLPNRNSALSMPDIYELLSLPSYYAWSVKMLFGHVDVCFIVNTLPNTATLNSVTSYIRDNSRYFFNEKESTKVYIIDSTGIILRTDFGKMYADNETELEQLIKQIVLNKPVAITTIDLAYRIVCDASDWLEYADRHVPWALGYNVGGFFNEYNFEKDPVPDEMTFEILCPDKLFIKQPIGVTARIKSGKVKAENVSITIEYPDDKLAFSWGETSRTWDSIDVGQEASCYVNLLVLEDRYIASGAEVSFTAKLQYTDAITKNIKTESVSKTAVIITEPAFDIDITCADNEIKAGDSIDIAAQITNNGFEKSGMVRLTLELPDELMLEQGVSTLTWSDFTVSQSRSAAWKIKLKEPFMKDLRKSFDIRVKLEYTIPDLDLPRTQEAVEKVTFLKNNKAIVVVPGFLGSNLYNADTGELMWHTLLMDVTEDITIAEVAELARILKTLACDVDGTPINAARARDDNGFWNVYENLLDKLSDDDSGISGENNILFFSHDWRLSYDKSAQELDKFISDYDQVVFVAHSMGGVLVENYIALYGTNKVTKLITSGTPYWGVPAALPGLHTGNMGYFVNDLSWQEELFTQSVFRNIVKNFGGVYDALPNRLYTTKQPWITFGIKYYSFDEYDSLMTNYYNQSLWKNAKDNHERIYQSMRSSSDLKRIAFVGEGYQTITQIDTFIVAIDGREEILYHIVYGDGDGLVPYESSTMDLNYNLLDIRFRPVSHMGTIQNNDIISEIISEIKNQDSSAPTIGYFAPIETGERLDLVNYIFFTGKFDMTAQNDHSLYSYKSESGWITGNNFKIDPIISSDTETLILSQFGETDFNFELISLEDQTTTIVLSFNETDYIYKDIVVEKGSILYIDMNNDELTLLIDLDGDGEIDKEILSKSEQKEARLRLDVVFDNIK